MLTPFDWILHTMFAITSDASGFFVAIAIIFVKPGNPHTELEQHGLSHATYTFIGL